MSDDDDFEVVCGSGNVYHDLNMPEASITLAANSHKPAPAIYCQHLQN